MAMRTERANVHEGAVEHLEEALKADDPDETDFHLRQALQIHDMAPIDD